MKKAFYLVCGLLLAFTLLLDVTVLPAYAQQPPQWRSSLPSQHGYHVSAIPAKGTLDSHIAFTL